MSEVIKLSDLQTQELDIFKTFVDICEKKQLRYFLVAGSMLGAKRHKGFIPWDDDIDVAMPRKDYDIFLESAAELLPEKYYLETPRDKKHYLIVSNIYSKDGGFVLNNSEITQSTGAWIDIMAIDGIPNPGLRQNIHWYCYMVLRAFYQISHFDEVVNQERDRPFFEKVIIKIAKITRLQKLLNPVKINYLIEKLMRSCDYDKSDYVATYCGIYRKKEIVPKKWYGNGAIYSFEDMQVYGLEDADKYLTQLYGNYMEPPKDKTSRHNVSVSPSK